MTINAASSYWKALNQRLHSEFNATRAAHRDSAVKGTANEQTLSEFLEQNLAAKTMSLNSTIIDAYGQRSDEVDIAVCNEYQPFRKAGSAELLIIEGVDAVYQVKARLDSAELERGVKNCRSVKRLRRTLTGSDAVRTNPADIERFAVRVPFFMIPALGGPGRILDTTLGG